mgnify:CR=1 FL=1
MLGLKPIKLLPARERVASAIREAIIQKKIKEGEILTLDTTAQELGVSVTPVREVISDSRKGWPDRIKAEQRSNCFGI